MKEKFKLALTVQIIPALLIFKVAVKTCSIVDTGSGRRWSSRGSGTVARENGRCQHQRQCHSSSHHHHQLLPRLPLARHWPIDRYITKCGVKEGRSVGFSVLSFKHFLGSYDRRPFVITCPLYRAQHTHIRLTIKKGRIIINFEQVVGGRCVRSIKVEIKFHHLSFEIDPVQSFFSLSL